MRIGSLLRMLPPGSEALEIGSRDGYITRRIAERFPRVTALDLSRPDIDLPNVECVAADVRALHWPDRQFDAVMCAEVLEHVPAGDLAQACNELQRVVRRHLLIGVPFEQDLRRARTRCGRCGGINPPYGHVNRFTRRDLDALFPTLRPVAEERVGSTRERTTFLAGALMRAARFPWGTYDQDEPCIHCGAAIAPPTVSIVARCLGSAASRLDDLSIRLTRPRPKWLHVLYERVVD